MENLTQLNELTDRVINCFFKVYNKLGYGFLEKVYERALFIELNKNGYKVDCQKPTDVEFGLLLNFGKRPEIRRKIFSNNLKK